MDWLVGKFGFDERLWRELEPRQQNWLSLSSALAMLSCLLFAVGGGYIAFVSSHGHRTQWIIALFIFTLTFIFAFNFRRVPLVEHARAVGGGEYQLKTVGDLLEAVFYCDAGHAILRKN